MSLQGYLSPTQSRRALEIKAMELLCKLHDETSKVKPDDDTVSNILQDLDVLVADYRRGK